MSARMKRPRRTPSVALEATIEQLAPGGDGVALTTIEGERRAVFVRGVTVGDRVRLDVDLGSRPARGRVVDLLAAGPDRVEPACPHVARCGGCDWMHVAPAAQQRAHETHVRAVLPAAWREHPIAVHAAPATLAYRTRARVHVRASGGRAIVGMNEASTHDPVEVDACAVLTPDLERARRAIAPLLEGAHGRGEAQIALGALDRSPRPSVLELRWSGSLAAACFARIEQAVASGLLAGARIMCGESTRPAIIGDPTPWMRGADGAALRLAPGGFGQASDDGNALLAGRVAALVRALAERRPGLRVAELYAGAGNLTVLLAPIAGDLVAVESSRDACDAARTNLSTRGLTARVVEADAASYVVGTATQLVVLDPPRTGAREAVQRLAASSIRHVLYVSCDPQTLGRDLSVLAGARFIPTAIDVFEMFPQTSHVETVILLERPRPS
jgi:23S rRNA (uracil1939-C5)-methyltransferase